MNGQLLLHLPIKSLKFASINSDPLPPPEYERVSRSRVLKVFVASPSDVIEERNALAKLIGDINDVLVYLAPEKQLRLELVRRETHAYPDIGRPRC